MARRQVVFGMLGTQLDAGEGERLFRGELLVERGLELDPQFVCLERERSAICQSSTARDRFASIAMCVRSRFSGTSFRKQSNYLRAVFPTLCTYSTS